MTELVLKRVEPSGPCVHAVSCHTLKKMSNVGYQVGYPLADTVGDASIALSGARALNKSICNEKLALLEPNDQITHCVEKK